MSGKIDPREVLAYLNELGYTNITAEQLKEFIKDLKKIIKYDSRYGGAIENTMKKQSYEENECCECLESDEKENSNTSNGTDKENHKNSIKSDKYPKRTETSTTTDIQRDKHIAVHIYDTKTRKYIDHEHCVHVDMTDAAKGQFTQDKLKICSNVCTSGSTKPGTTESSIKTIPPGSTRELLHSRASRASSKDRKSRVTFIRPAISKPSINKSDPVALYHYYQSQWKKTKIPGQDKRDDLRWAVRAKMLSGPRVEVRSKCNIPRCGWSR